jgi:hypothetical protein
MNPSTRTTLIGILAALAAIGGGAVVADASHHASFASSATQGGPGAFGRPGGPPSGSGAPPANAGDPAGSEGRPETSR